MRLPCRLCAFCSPREFFFCVYTHCSGNQFTEPLPSNGTTIPPFKRHVTLHCIVADTQCAVKGKESTLIRRTSGRSLATFEQTMLLLPLHYKMSLTFELRFYYTLYRSPRKVDD
jgi:hypothetical protein